MLQTHPDQSGAWHRPTASLPDILSRILIFFLLHKINGLQRDIPSSRCRSPYNGRSQIHTVFRRLPEWKSPGRRGHTADTACISPRSIPAGWNAHSPVMVARAVPPSYTSPPTVISCQGDCSLMSDALIPITPVPPSLPASGTAYFLPPPVVLSQICAGKMLPYQR